MGVYFRTSSAWAQMQNWHKVQSARTQALIGSGADLLSATSSRFNDAATNYYAGKAKLAAQAALSRLQAAVKAKTDSVDTTA
jgi:hypothetical protein